MSRDENGLDAVGERPKRGRPRCWSDTRSRQQAHRERQRVKLRLVDELPHAVRNAHREDREEQRQINDGDDAAVLAVLVQHDRARHWSRRQAPQVTAETKGGAAEEALP
jgi:hypothetical protein